MAKVETKPEKKPTKPVGTLERGLHILKLFRNTPEATVPEIAEFSGLSRSTTYRLAEQLSDLGYLELAKASGRWRLGTEAVQLGVAALQSTEVMTVAPEKLRHLMEITGEAVNLAVFDTDSMVLLFREQGPQSVTISSRLGSRRPMHASSLGKAWLAAMPSSERRLLLSRLKLDSYAPSTITKLTDLDAELAKISERGYATDSAEFEPTLACCAAVILDHRRFPVAAISASGPAERVQPQTERIGQMVAETAKSISRRLGCPDLR